MVVNMKDQTQQTALNIGQEVVHQLQSWQNICPKGRDWRSGVTRNAYSRIRPLVIVAL